MEKNATMSDCIGEDHKQEGRLKFLEDKHQEINGIIELIESTPRH